MAFNNLSLRIFTSFFLMVILMLFIIFFETYLLYLILFVYFIILYEIIFFFNNKKDNYFFLIAYFIFFLVSTISYFQIFYTREIFVFLLIILILFDSTSYFLGAKFGIRKIFPYISPNKTLFGFFSGFLITFFISILYNYYFDILTLSESLIFIPIIILSSFLGDILESYFKRKSFLKDSSNLLPGHGGFFDRLDSFVMSIVALNIYYLIYAI